MLCWAVSEWPNQKWNKSKGSMGWREAGKVLVSSLLRRRPGREISPPYAGAMVACNYFTSFLELEGPLWPQIRQSLQRVLESCCNPSVPLQFAKSSSGGGGNNEETISLKKKKRKYLLNFLHKSEYIWKFIGHLFFCHSFHSLFPLKILILWKFCL